MPVRPMQAVLSVLMNINSPDVQLGPTLQDLREFCGSFDGHMKGLTLSNSEQIRTTHNSFARQTLFEFDSKKAEKDDDVFHFVSYIPIDGRIYELDGLQEGPIDHGPVGEDWTDTIRPILEARMNKYKEGEIHFNLMGVVEDKIARYNRQLVGASEGETARLEMLLADEENRRARWRIENIRRRHNYLPLIMEFMRSLAKRGELIPLYNKAQEKAAALEKRKKEKGSLLS
jgi:ubiquitin carboxyl-terminal hydrolase L5